jgi:hypothetical protein
MLEAIASTLVVTNLLRREIKAAKKATTPIAKKMISKKKAIVVPKNPKFPIEATYPYVRSSFAEAISF